MPILLGVQQTEKVKLGKWRENVDCGLWTPLERHPRPPHPPIRQRSEGVCVVWECAGRSRQRQRNPGDKMEQISSGWIWGGLMRALDQTPSLLRLMGFQNGLVCVILHIHLQAHFTAHINEPNQLIIQYRRGQDEIIECFLVPSDLLSPLSGAYLIMTMWHKRQK